MSPASHGRRCVPRDWQRLSQSLGTKGERLFDWARLPVVHAGTVDGRHLLVVRRCLDNPHELAYYLVWAPPDTPLPIMVQAIGARWHIEEDLEASKALGLDQYEVRSYLGWYRHITLVLLASAFLAQHHASRATLTASAKPEAVACSPLIPLTTSEAQHLLARLFFPAPTGCPLICQWSLLSASPPILGWLLSSSPPPKSRLSLPLKPPASSPGRLPSLQASFPRSNSRTPRSSLSEPGSARSCCLFHTKGVPMTFVSLAEATRRLGIDVKTLHRWLAEAQISLHSHPDDGRKKGLVARASAGAAALARRRSSLAPLPQQSPAATVGEGRELPARAAGTAGTAVRLAGSAGGVAAADGCSHAPAPAADASAVSLAKPSRMRGRSSTPAPLAPRAHPSAKTPASRRRSELEKRLLADTCEYCGTTGDRERIEVHHVRALKDLKTRRSRETSLGQNHGGQETQNTGVMRHLPSGRHLWKTDETKAEVCFTECMMLESPLQ